MSMRVVFRHAWMQKHPTPSNRQGDFHWHPPGVPEAIRGTLTELATRERGRKTSLWIVADSYLAWARTFGALSPLDQRRYTGLAVTIARPASNSAGTPARNSASWSESLPEVLARLPLADSAPLAAGAERSVSHCDLESTPGATRPLAIDPPSLRRLFRDGDSNLAAALYRGGQAQSLEPQAERLPALVGRLLSWLPATERALPRTGVFTERPVSSKPANGNGLDNLLHYLTGGWFCPLAIHRRRPGYAIDCWQLVLDLAASASCSLADVFDDLTGVARAWNTSEDLYRHLIERGTLSSQEITACNDRAPRPLCNESVADAGWLWNRLLHFWGRGFITEDALPRLADLLARRIAADHLFYLDAPQDVSLPERYLRRLRYEALLPRGHVAAMLDALRRLLPSLTPGLASTTSTPSKNLDDLEVYRA